MASHSNCVSKMVLIRIKTYVYMGYEKKYSRITIQARTCQELCFYVHFRSMNKTDLDISYITSRLAGEFENLFKCC